MILPRYRSLQSGEIQEKTGPDDLVTIADIESERRMTPLLKDLLPGSYVVGEEAVSADNLVLNALTEDAPVWIVDPVDGTRNFARGDRKFCVMVALLHRRQSILGCILDPLGERCAVASRGSGAWMVYNGGREERLSVLGGRPCIEMRGALNFRFLSSPLKEEMKERAKTAVGEHFRYGCAGHEYLTLLTGAAHFAMYPKNMPWDHVAGTLLHEEAGGFHARFNKMPYIPHQLDGGLLLAPDEPSWDDLRDRLWP
ncbi:inositol monophosphatase [Nisaea acidiphila]|uniref:Inositol monophosphatase n=1 Tax=Nisaea acidiphila TaxID=1862145 RepID=A0A9J7AV44_9PROT|nr:inositol monophosphatase family protein [Nisaea acidiphila]UUX50180.1 inositol monophosphatase [Nisaea acidiphila]